MVLGRNISVVAAVSMNGVYGTPSNELPWRSPKDLARFKELTRGHTVVMGRKTWDSLPKKFRPLPGRANIVVTRNTEFVADGALVVRSMTEAVERAETEKVFFIGGKDVWYAAMDSADEAYITVIQQEYPREIGMLIADELTCLKDTWKGFVLVKTTKEFDEDPDKHVSFHVHFEHWVRKNS